VLLRRSIGRRSGIVAKRAVADQTNHRTLGLAALTPNAVAKPVPNPPMQPAKERSRLEIVEVTVNG